MSSALRLGLTRSRRIMATTASITAVGTDPGSLIDGGLGELERLEQLWSRFREDSDISRLNRADGSPVDVAPETAALLAHMRRAHEGTHGSFDPRRLRIQVSAGDDSSLDGSPLPALSPARVDGDLASWFDLLSPTVVVPQRGIAFDAGGIGKGMAADMVALLLVNRGADTVCVNVGGDLRIASRDGHEIDWPVMVGPPREVVTTTETLSLRSGAVATSDIAARRRPDGSVAAHIVADDGPARTDVVGATVVAGTAAWAEAWTKHLFMVEPSRALADVDNAGLAARVVLADGTITHSPRWIEFCR